MKSLIPALAALLLAGCGGNFCPTDHHGLDGPPQGSAVPDPHG